MNRNKQKQIRNREYCLGHIAYRNNRCPDCKADEFNKNCEDYCPIRFMEFDVKENGKEKQDS